MWKFHDGIRRRVAAVHSGDTMRFLIVRTEIRSAADTDLAAVWARGGRLRDEQSSPEPRRQILHADDRDAALCVARALAAVGAVRSGRQRVKVLPIGDPAHPTGSGFADPTGLPHG